MLLKDVRVKDIEECGLACPYFEYHWGARCNRRGGRRIQTGPLIGNIVTPDEIRAPEWCPLREKPILLRLKQSK
jgi:hypothetical protein